MSSTTNGPIDQANNAVPTYAGPPSQHTGILNPDELNRIIPLTSSDTASGNSGKVLACVAGIIVGVALIALMGGLGTAGLLHNTGLAQYPQWLVNQINNIPNIYLDVMMYAGYIGGVITIAISGALLYKTLNPKAAEASIATLKAGHREMTDEEKAFMQGERGVFTDDMSVNGDQWAEFPKQWKEKLTEDSTCIYQKYTKFVYRVILRDKNGNLTISKAFLNNTEKNTLIKIIVECNGYTVSRNQ